MFDRRKFLAASGAVSASVLGFGRPALARQPLDSARIVVGFVAGGLSDTMARRMADRMRGNYANAVVVENKPGASGQIANGFVKDAVADGSVLLLTHSSSLSMYPFTFKNLPYRPMEDFRPVSSACYTNHAFCVGPAVPESVRSMKDFLAWAGANPERANYGAPGVGSMPHLIMTVVNKTAGADLQPVVYKGTAAAVTDMLGGQISGVSGPVGNFMPMVRSGKARLIAISGDARSSFVPDLPTYREQGFDMTAREWYGLFLPAKASDAAVQLANKAVVAALSDPSLVDFMKQAGADVVSCTPAQLADMLAKDTQEWRRLIKEVGFTAES
ncbi:tripartite tricarboxylate transporter substrate-binding protein [Xenophilus azovorans]|uniref:tripartite tricarboxylate transporter substrate-binding protein n=1 Tax=Xenophilus azovorans TaxID=151755 RepID=UPI00057019C1|nr:tripartite tricarboxylate transporter substrate-binding protein [Xenophilus azovorans]